MSNNEDVVGIVIVNYNGLKDTLECIESIKSSKTRYSIRIIIVDNCSKNDELEIIEKNTRT